MPCPDAVARGAAVVRPSPVECFFRKPPAEVTPNLGVGSYQPYLQTIFMGFS